MGDLGRESRFVDSDGLDCTELLEKLSALDEVWRLYWPKIYDTKYKQYLKAEILDHPHYSKAWRVATNHFNAVKDKYGFQKTFQNKFGKKFPSDDFHIAIVAYTLNHVDGTQNRLFEDFNKASRELTVDKFPQFQFKSFWYLLGFSVPQLQNISIPDDVVLFRGLHDFHYSNRELKRCIMSRTPIVLGTSFVSTSDKKSLAEMFGQGLNCYNCPHKKCFLTFRGKPNYGNYIKQHSEYPTEGEVLVCPWSQWIVTGVSYSGKWQLVTLEPNSDQPMPAVVTQDSKEKLLSLAMQKHLNI